MSDIGDFASGVWGCACLTCGRAWLYEREAQCDCPRPTPGPPAYITGVDQERGIITVDSKPPKGET